MMNNKGITLAEILVSLAISVITLAGVYLVYTTQVEQTGRQYKTAESEMELGIAKGIIGRDIATAGYGLAEDYDFNSDGIQDFAPMAIGAADADPDTLTIMGTALGMESRQAQGWTFFQTTVPDFRGWGDVREDVDTNDRVIVIEPGTKRLIAEGGDWLFRYDGANANPAARITSLPGGIALINLTVGNLVYGLHGNDVADAAQPFYAVTYSLGGASPPTCANGTLSLLRVESTAVPAPLGGDPLLTCVLDLQIAFGLDSNEDGTIDLWDDGGAQAALLTARDLNRRLKQVRVYILVQLGNRDVDYTYPLATIRVGDTNLAIGRDINLTAEQRRFRWKLLSLSATPRNMR